MNTTDALRDLRATAADLPAKAAAARATLSEMFGKAQDLTVQAHSRARGEINRRRSTAAETLEDLASALRPDRDARRKTLAVAGGSGLLLTAALGIGVAIGLVMSRELKKRADQRVEDALSEGIPPMPTAAMDADPIVPVGLNH